MSTSDKTREQKIHDLKVKIAAYETIVMPYAIALSKAKRELIKLQDTINASDDFQPLHIYDIY